MKMMMKVCACVLVLAVLAESAPQYFYQEVPEAASGHRRLRSYEYVAVYPGDFAYSGASGLASTGFNPYPHFYPYGGSSAASSAAAYGGRNGLAPYGGASAASSAAAAQNGYRGGSAAAAAAAAAGGAGYY